MAPVPQNSQMVVGGDLAAGPPGNVYRMVSEDGLGPRHQRPEYVTPGTGGQEPGDGLPGDIVGWGAGRGQGLLLPGQPQDMTVADTGKESRLLVAKSVVQRRHELPRFFVR